VKAIGEENTCRGKMANSQGIPKTKRAELQTDAISASELMVQRVGGWQLYKNRGR
jgi:hypothetical protein